MIRMHASSLGVGEAHLWALGPAELDQAEQQLQGALDPLERQKSEAMPAERGRRWRQRRCALRGLLAGYLDRDPAELPLGTDALGKPQLVAGGARLHFNASASGGTLLLAVCEDQPVGVDVESVDVSVNAWAVARKYFSEQELAQLEAVQGKPAFAEAFLRFWTRKEARLKVYGLGLRGLEALAEEGLEVPERQAWIEDLRLAGGLVGALALPKAPTWVRYRSEGLFGGPSTEAAIQRAVPVLQEAR